MLGYGSLCFYLFILRAERGEGGGFGLAWGVMGREGEGFIGE